MEKAELKIILKPTTFDDLETLYLFQTDQEAIYMAAFTPLNPEDKSAFIEKYSALLINPEIHQQTIWLNKKIVGSIAKFSIDGDAEITYWIDKLYWGKGIAKKALKQFLEIESTRPIFGRVAFDNFPSQKVLESNGFIKTETDYGFANARQKVIEEMIYVCL